MEFKIKDKKLNGLFYDNDIVAMLDHEKSILELTRNYLVAQDINLKEFKSIETLRGSLNYNFALIILGIDSSCLLATSFIKTTRNEYTDTAIIIISSSSDTKFALECIRSGADEYIVNTAKNDELLSLFRKVLEKRMIIIENRKYQEQIEEMLFEYQINKSKHQIYRCIEFPPEFYQAGISILNYFSRLVELKYPDIPIQIKIEQDGKKVAMTIVTPEGKKETIIKTLEEYSLVIQGKLLPEDILPEPYQVIELKHKLDMAKLELKHTCLLMNSQNDQFKNRIISLENQVEDLRVMLGKGLDNTDNLQQLISVMFSKGYQYDSIKYELNELQRIISGHVDVSHEMEVKKILISIKEKEPSLFVNLNDLLLKGAISGAAGNLLYSWIIAVSNALPK